MQIYIYENIIEISRRKTDVQPGSLLIDFVPALQRLPNSLKPWLKSAKRMRERELRLHRAFRRTLKKQVAEDSAPRCFGSLLVQVTTLNVVLGGFD